MQETDANYVAENSAPCNSTGSHSHSSSSVSSPLQPLKVNSSSSVSSPLQPLKVNSCSSVSSPLQPLKVNSSSSVSSPLQPLKVNGTSTSFKTEERGDLIKFYNHVYIQDLKTFALKFKPTNQDINVSAFTVFTVLFMWLFFIVKSLGRVDYFSFFDCSSPFVFC